MSLSEEEKDEATKGLFVLFLLAVVAGVVWAAIQDPEILLAGFLIALFASAFH